MNEKPQDDKLEEAYDAVDKLRTSMEAVWQAANSAIDELNKIREREGKDTPDGGMPISNEPLNPDRYWDEYKMQAPTRRVVSQAINEHVAKAVRDIVRRLLEIEKGKGK